MILWTVDDDIFHLFTISLYNFTLRNITQTHILFGCCVLGTFATGGGNESHFLFATRYESSVKPAHKFGLLGKN